MIKLKMCFEETLDQIKGLKKADDGNRTRDLFITNEVLYP